MPYTRMESMLGPIGPKDVQIQRSSLVDELDVMLRDACLQARREHLGKRYNGYTYEIIPDGAGVKHYNLTAHFAATGDESIALDPRNMNDAPTNIFGNTVDRAELERRGIGQSDRRWKGS